MPLIDKIEQLQKKPEAVRKRILIISVMIIMFLIIAVWTSLFKFSYGNEKNEQPASSPFAIVKNTIKDSYALSRNEINSALDDLRKVYGGY